MDPHEIPNEQRKKRDLRRMKLIATGFLVLAALVYASTHLYADAGAWVGYLRAAAEASMVGALADWFAVTALFRHPLRLPIPHTAIIPSRKDALGDSLGEFVGANFLSEDVVRDKLHRAQLTARFGAWLAVPENAERITAEASTVLGAAVTVLRDDDVQAVIEQAVVGRVVAKPWGPPLGRIFDEVLTDGSHHRLVDLVVDRAYVWVRDNQSTVLRVVSERAPGWSPKFVDEMVAERVYKEVLNFAWAVKTDVNHPMRMALDKFLLEFAHDLQHDERTMQRAEQVKEQVLEHPAVRQLIGSTWTTAKRMLLDAAADPSSELRRRMYEGLRGFGKRLSDDEELRAKLDRWIEGIAGYVVRNYSTEITTLISDTVQRWDAHETARKVELQVGRDLQFIRINGTVVGALAGLAIHAISQLLT